MREAIRQALLYTFKARLQAAELQIERGTTDTGNRSQVTSGKHLDALAQEIISDIERMGINPEDIYTGSSGVEIPGWFRATKKWDTLVFCGNSLVAAIELKSMYSSYGNNLNNRVEEALGESTDAMFAIKNQLIDQNIPPILGYVMVVKKDAKSSSTCNRPREDHFKVDSIFYDTSYIDRLEIMCKRLLREGLFGAVWFVVIDPVQGTIEEPNADLSYDKFMAAIRGKVAVFLS